MYRHTENVALGGKLRTETGRDRSDTKPNKEMLMGKSMKETGVSHSIGAGDVPRDMGVGKSGKSGK